MNKWLQAARVYVIGASALPAVLGASLAYYETGRFNPINFLCSFLGVVLIHAAANLLNDYYDYQSGVDSNNPEGVFPFSGGSRVILENKLTPQEVYDSASFCLVTASLIGVYLTRQCGIGVLMLGTYGIITAVYYVHPRFNLLNLGLGEIIVGLNFGVLIISGSYYVQTGYFSVSAVMAAIPVSLMIALVLIINEFPDYRGDKLFSKMTIVVRLGRKRASYLVIALLGSAVFSLVLNVAWGFTNTWSLAALFTLPFMINAAACCLAHYDNIPGLIPSNISIIKTHLFLNLYLSLSCILSGKLRSAGFILLGLVLVYQLLTMRRLQTVSQLGSLCKRLKEAV